MPISVNYLCVFVHIPRTGGTSIEKTLGIHRDWPTTDREVFHGKWELEFDYLQLQHLPYPEMKSIADISHTRSYFKFTFVRNPWERLVSEYFWQNLQDRISFNKFVARVARVVRERTKIKGTYCHFRPQSEYLTDDLDFVGRFENFTKDVRKIHARLGCECQEIPHSGNTDHKNYVKYYDNQSAESVAEIYKSDIQLFGYDFET